MPCNVCAVFPRRQGKSTLLVITRQLLTCQLHSWKAKGGSLPALQVAGQMFRGHGRYCKHRLGSIMGAASLLVHHLAAVAAQMRGWVKPCAAH